MSDECRETAAVENHSHRKIKQARDSTNGVDLISSLPDVILQHIFSQIPTKYAIRTSVLSKRWKLPRYSSPKITSFRLSISTTEAKPKQIDSLIEFAVSRSTEKLSLEFCHAYAVLRR
ncbi:hypothetical protein F2Q69_00000110 [Brassica cretica]|uniref:F-box domain-containing protein n=1 Tax=Brassica cretica TaxID=69181 RepID=A0A8S9NPT9_BRACR|nr:hypothetical protein F2Q69_00000110 [Brassica cretica]